MSEPIDTDDPSSFGSSVLGTRDHWDKAYSREIQNFDDHGDIGEIWFGEDSVEKMVDWVLENASDNSQSIVDLGCGNGHLLLELSSLGYSSLTGIDYSQPAITLATKIADEQSRQITYRQYDLLAPASSIGPFDLALDKGTFDAISLAEKEEDGKGHPADGYAKAVSGMLKEGGVLLITSCNWVEAELVKRFEECKFFHESGASTVVS
ncbi:Methyltransferase-like protein 10 [Rhizophlyctis rosea]|uniref:Protein-lysine N-methyltransferase EFM4 n=1 Tax=Rhizophlyctis rosea TaxID=64517 RepID=A0AAD5X1G7_9FUNG|nr:Methyltransferase-like protein 10 [Rhizophlyctis rosea]